MIIDITIPSSDVTYSKDLPFLSLDFIIINGSYFSLKYMSQDFIIQGHCKERSRISYNYKIEVNEWSLPILQLSSIDRKSSDISYFKKSLLLDNKKYISYRIYNGNEILCHHFFECSLHHISNKEHPRHLNFQFSTDYEGSLVTI